MIEKSGRKNAKEKAIHRTPRLAKFPVNKSGTKLRVSEFFGENVFDLQSCKSIPDKVKKEVTENRGQFLTKENAEIVAQAVTDWATEKGATHFSHWFQPLTGSTAEKHDAFLSFEKGIAIEKLSGSQLMQGEPDASSFPHGGSRSTFEARGYTAWDVTSPMFIMEDLNGKTLCIPTAFVSYHGDALDVKTPLLRSTTQMSEVVTKFLNLCGEKEVKDVRVTCGAEQEYFLVDKSFYYLRPDLIQSGRALLGSLTARNQQLEDHYFGTIPDRVLSFIQELEIELYKLGIPAKTRHNEVAPGQFELAPIFKEANLAADHNQLVMALLKKVALNHDFVVLLHEKPFAGINGSGKHLNWSLCDDQGNNLLEPGNNPHQNFRFLAFVAMICEAVHRHSAVLRSGISGAGNDHRLGANEAPPSIMSIFLGDTITRIFESIKNDKELKATSQNYLDLGADQLARLLKDNTDRNRTSPFAFTGNKFEFRAVGSSMPVGIPMTILNAAVVDIIRESNILLEKELSSGKKIDDALLVISKKWITNSFNIIFNGDGYSQEWVKEAHSRGLPNMRTTPESLASFKDEKLTQFLVTNKIYKQAEIRTRYNVLVERYNKLREIEFNTLTSMVHQFVIPAAINYKNNLMETILKEKEIGLTSKVEREILRQLNDATEDLYVAVEALNKALDHSEELDEEKKSFMFAQELMPLCQKIAECSNKIEEYMPDDKWGLPKFLEMLFIR